MRKIYLGILAAVVLAVVINIYVRTGSPYFDLESVSPSFAAIGVLRIAAAAFLTPGTYALWYLGFTPDTWWELVAAAILSWWTWLTCPRLVWSIVGRAFGVIHTADFRWWLMLAVPWRPFYRVWLRFSGWCKQFLYGSRATTAWTGVLAAMTLVFQPGDYVYLGRLWAFGVGLFQVLGLRGPRHLTVIGGSGSGKTSYLRSFLGTLHKDASAFVIDCAAEIINALGAPLERAGHRVLNLDAYGLSRFPRASWNGIEELDRVEERHGRQAVVRYAMTLAEALIIEDNKNQPIFATVARTFVLSLCLFVWLCEPPEERNLIRVRELLTRGMPGRVSQPDEDPFAALLRVMIASTTGDDRCDGQIADVIARGAAAMQSGQRAKEGNVFRTTALAQLAWLDIPEVAAISRHSDFSCADLKTTNCCVFMVAPVLDIRTKLAPFVRVLTMMMLTTFENMPGRMKIPSTWCLDEMPSLRIPDLDVAAPTVRRFGIRLIVISQDIELLRKAYPDSYGGFIGNSMATIFMGTEHQETLELISKLLGTRTLVEVIDGGWFSKSPKRVDRREHPLLHPHQVKEFLDPERGQMIVVRAGKSPLRVAVERPERGLPVWAIEGNPDFPEPFLRALARKVMDYLWLRKPPVGPRREAASTALALMEDNTNGIKQHV